MARQKQALTLYTCIHIVTYKEPFPLFFRLAGGRVFYGFFFLSFIHVLLQHAKPAATPYAYKYARRKKKRWLSWAEKKKKAYLYIHFAVYIDLISWRGQEIGSVISQSRRING